MAKNSSEEKQSVAMSIVRKTPQLASYAAVIILWFAVARFYARPAIMPGPISVGREMWRIIVTGQAVTHISVTMIRIALGFAISMCVGVGLGVLMGIRKYWEGFLKDIIAIGISIPAICWALIGVLWFGLSPFTPVFATSMVAIPYVVVNIWEGVKAVDKDLVDMGTAFNMARTAVLRRIILPSLNPFIFSSVRSCFSTCWKIVTIAEIFASSNGMGYMITYSFQRFSVNGILAWTVLFVIIIILIEYFAFRIIEKKIFKWRMEIVVR